MNRRVTAAQPLPTGTLTFLMTDVESSTQLWRSGSHAAAVMARHAELIGAAVASHDGVRPLEQGEGDSTVSAFRRASDAVAAALDAQRALAVEPWPDGAAPRVRMAIHTGEAELRDQRTYGGTAIIRCARLRSLAHGGQVLVSGTTSDVVEGRVPDGVTLTEIDTVTIAGFDRPVRVHQLRHPDLPSQFPPLRHVRTASLGPWLTPLVGRARERRDVAALLTDGRAITITGAGGSGKTRLAHALAEDMLERYRDGVAWVELARLSSGAQIAGAVVRACGVPEVAGLSALDVLLRHVAEAEILLVLDNCEHLLDDCARLVAAVLHAGAAVTVLATSREPLGVAGEVTWRIPSLSLAPESEHDVARLLEFDAARLFVERARAARPEFQLDATTAPAVVRICRRLDGLPLALELAAARLRALSLERLADGLDDRFRLLTGGARTAVARQRTLLASVEWSHELLDDPERVLFRRLGVFAAPFHLEAAEAVASDDRLDRFTILDLIARLVDKSLVQHHGDRYWLLETLRQYALERAAEASELPELRARHLAWLSRRARGWRLDREVATRHVLDQVGAEVPDLVAALEWSLSPGQCPAIELLFPIACHCLATFAHEETLAVSARVLATFEEGSTAWLSALAPVALALFFAAEIGWMPAARRALDVRGDDLDPSVRGFVEHTLSVSLAFAGRPEGMAGLRRAIEAGRAAGNRRIEIEVTGGLAGILAATGDQAAARPLLAWLDRHMPPDADVRFLLDMGRAITATYDGDFATARRHLGAYLVRDRLPPVGTVTAAALTGHWSGDEVLLRQAVAVAERHGQLGVFEVYKGFLRAMLALWDDDLDAAVHALRDGSYSTPLGIYAWQRQWLLAEVLLSRGEADECAALLDEVESHLDGTVLHFIRMSVHDSRAHVARSRGDTEEADRHAHFALEQAAEHEIALLTTDALETLALVAADAGRVDEAGRLLGAAEAFRERTGYTWRFPYRRRALDTLRAALDPVHRDEGARMSLPEAVAYARRGRGERDRPSHGWDSLTPSEARVVELVAEGLPNREIAEKLFVSVATVKTHLVHVYGKVDVRTRAELAGVATARRLGTRTG